LGAKTLTLLKVDKRFLNYYLCLKLFGMELTLNIKEQSKIAAFLNLIKEMDYIEIINVKEVLYELPDEHKDLLDKRLQRIESGKTTFKKWDLIKEKYDGKAV